MSTIRQGKVRHSTVRHDTARQGTTAYMHMSSYKLPAAERDFRGCGQYSCFMLVKSGVHIAASRSAILPEGCGGSSQTLYANTQILQFRSQPLLNS